MTTTELPRTPTAADPEPEELEPASSAWSRWNPTEEELQRAVQLAAEAGQRAAVWVRELAGRQVEQHALVLENAAAAIEQTTAHEILPDGEGELNSELRYALDAGVLTGAMVLESVPELTCGERIALAAVLALTASMPGTVLNYYDRELPVLAQVMDDAVAAGRAAAPTR
ncbi:hypothetical protein ACIHEI_33935 [Kitasatospora sp. NPDC051984]|uniref:hypothetical protein n=1 Tax=Kitasatospora sp. NPDC051984 TaxID=3364059 RepID=UPI0037CAF373